LAHAYDWHKISKHMNRIGTQDETQEHEVKLEYVTHMNRIGTQDMKSKHMNRIGTRTHWNEM
jgi:hypothetical protein